MPHSALTKSCILLNAANFFLLASFSDYNSYLHPLYFILLCEMVMIYIPIKLPSYLAFSSSVNPFYFLEYNYSYPTDVFDFLSLWSNLMASGYKVGILEAHPQGMGVTVKTQGIIWVFSTAMVSLRYLF